MHKLSLTLGPLACMPVLAQLSLQDTRVHNHQPRLLPENVISAPLSKPLEF